MPNFSLVKLISPVYLVQQIGGINKMCNDAELFGWLNMRADIEKKAKTCSASLNAGKNLKFQQPLTKKNKIEPPKKPGQEIQIDFTGNLNNKNLQSNPY